MFVRQVIGWLFLVGISENQERSASSRVNSDQAMVRLVVGEFFLPKPNTVRHIYDSIKWYYTS